MNINYVDLKKGEIKTIRTIRLNKINKYLLFRLLNDEALITDIFSFYASSFANSEMTRRDGIMKVSATSV